MIDSLKFHTLKFSRIKPRCLGKTIRGKLEREKETPSFSSRINYENTHIINVEKGPQSNNK